MFLSWDTYETRVEEQKHSMQTEEYRPLLQMRIPACSRRSELLSIRDGNPLQSDFFSRRKYIHTFLGIRTHSVTNRGSYPPYCLVDLQSNRNGECKFTMVYQDHLTKFVQLRTLKTKRDEEVAYHVLSLFLTFSAPVILQSDNDRKSSNQDISKICAMWKDAKTVHGKPRHSQTQVSVVRVNQDVHNTLMSIN
ncbi:SCAN domain-containing protein 3 [Trichonephila clavipes]|nr:SCAN domain-containing protein 3 [Trichonephila clavipes]